MPHRSFAARESGLWPGIPFHPDCLRLVEKPGDTERYVSALGQTVGLTLARTSGQLGILRSHRLVGERREGRRVFYRLARPELAAWLLLGIDLMKRCPYMNERVRAIVRQAREKRAHG